MKLPSGIQLPDGTEVELIVPDTDKLSPTSKLKPGWFAERFKDYIGIVKDGPPDLAENHDHYAHGTPKRSRP